MKKIFVFSTLLTLLLFNTSEADAQGTYYDNVDAQVVNNGLACMPLKQALHDLIDGHTVRDYSTDFAAFICTYDVDANGFIIDRYKNTSAVCSGSSLPGGQINREHVLPRSWWGGSTSVDQFSDYHNLFPSDVGTNSDKSAYPLGIVGSSIGAYPYTTFPMTNIGLDGLPCTNIDNTTNFDDNVFEPDNAYKGDFARAFLYMAVRYQDEIISQNWDGINPTTVSVFSNDILTIYEPCLLSLLLQWHNQDPPSQLEIDRNNAIALAANQGNRNPFIDHPEYADLIWNTNCDIAPGVCENRLDNCDWNAVSVVTNTGTQATWICDATGNYDINAYTNSNNPSEQWLVYGPVDMTTTTTANLVLDITENFAGPDLEFLWNATSGSPTAAGWNSVMMAGNTSVTGLVVNYGAAVGNSTVYLGIKYTATGAAGGTHAFTLSNIAYQSSCCAGIDLSINFDGFPAQTSWDIVDANNNVVASGGTYTGAIGNSNMLESTCLPDGCYTLNFYDAIGNGMCPFQSSASSSGTFITPGTLITPGSVVATLGSVVAPGLCGNYSLSDANGTTLASGGGGFGSAQSRTFCLTNGLAPLWHEDNNHTKKMTTESVQLQLVPNLVRNQITLYYSVPDTHDVQLYITDINGRVMQQYIRQAYDNGQTQIDVSGLQSGFYVVQLVSGQTVISKKFVKV